MSSKHFLTCLSIVGSALFGCGDDSPAPHGGGGAGGAAGGAGGVASVGGAGGAGGAAEPRLALDFVEVPFETQLSYITDLAFTPDGSGRFMVIDLYGGFELAQLNEEDATVLFSAALTDVYVEYDAGLLALAIDPDFAENGYFYLALNLAKNHVVVRRYALDINDPAATLASETVILDLQVPSSPRWHNITSMGFEPSGVMWLLVGDKGISLPSAADPTMTVAQDETSLLGSLTRILPSKDPAMGGYEPVTGGPTYSPTSDPAVYAKGLRSPWQGLYHDGRWYYGEVGLDDIEEVNVISEAGQNFGWPVVEGPCEKDLYGHMPDCTLYTDPWVWFNRSASSPFVLDDPDAVPTNKRSVYAGWIYEPNALDPYDGLWNDVLVWGDAFVGFMRASKIDGDSSGWPIGHQPFPSAWAQGPDGYVYMIALSEEPNAGDPSMMSGLPSPLRRAVLVH
ncbi:MAG: PQQ-dependent sugar dehydrogenase [Polyangiaceae bacterium]